jgi:hypothetical protein
MEYSARVHLVPSVLRKLKPMYSAYHGNVPGDYNMNFSIVSRIL